MDTTIERPFIFSRLTALQKACSLINPQTGHTPTQSDFRNHDEPTDYYARTRGVAQARIKSRNIDCFKVVLAVCTVFFVLGKFSNPSIRATIANRRNLAALPENLSLIDTLVGTGNLRRIPHKESLIDLALNEAKPGQPANLPSLEYGSTKDRYPNVNDAADNVGRKVESFAPPSQVNPTPIPVQWKEKPTILIKRAEIAQEEVDAEAEEEEAILAYVSFFLFSLLMAAFLQWVVSCISAYSIPASIVWFLFGMAIDLIVSRAPEHTTNSIVLGIRRAAKMNAEVVYLILLPILLYEASLNVDWHKFKRFAVSGTTLAVLGVGYQVAVVGLLIQITFPSQTFISGAASWWNSFLIASSMASTDPVAVISVLTSLQAPPKLATMFDGEALINDGSSMLLFQFFKSLAHGEVETAADIVTRFLSLLVFAPIWGVAVSYLSYLWMQRFHMNAQTAAVALMGSAYTVYVAGEKVLYTSGPISVVCFGLFYNGFGHIALDNEAQQHHHHSVQALASLANSSVFVIAGVVAMRMMYEAVTASDGLSAAEVWNVPVLYLYLLIARASMVLVFLPVLKRTGYGVNWKEMVLLVWGGIRGAIVLAMGLMIEQDHQILSLMRYEAVLYIAGCTFAILLINGGTFELLYRILNPYPPKPFRRVYMEKVMKLIDYQYLQERRVLEDHWLFRGTNILYHADKVAPVLGWRRMNERGKIDLRLPSIAAALQNLPSCATWIVPARSLSCESLSPHLEATGFPPGPIPVSPHEPCVFVCPGQRGATGKSKKELDTNPASEPLELSRTVFSGHRRWDAIAPPSTGTFPGNNMTSATRPGSHMNRGVPSGPPAGSSPAQRKESLDSSDRLDPAEQRAHMATASLLGLRHDPRNAGNTFDAKVYLRLIEHVTEDTNGTGDENEENRVLERSRKTPQEAVPSSGTTQRLPVPDSAVSRHSDGDESLIRYDTDRTIVFPPTTSDAAVAASPFVKTQLRKNSDEGPASSGNERHLASSRRASDFLGLRRAITASPHPPKDGTAEVPGSAADQRPAAIGFSSEGQISEPRKELTSIDLQPHVTGNQGRSKQLRQPFQFNTEVNHEAAPAGVNDYVENNIYRVRQDLQENDANPPRITVSTETGEHATLSTSNRSPNRSPPGPTAIDSNRTTQAYLHASRSHENLGTGDQGLWYGAKNNSWNSNPPIHADFHPPGRISRRGLSDFDYGPMMGVSRGSLPTLHSDRCDHASADRYSAEDLHAMLNGHGALDPEGKSAVTDWRTHKNYGAGHSAVTDVRYAGDGKYPPVCEETSYKASGAQGLRPLQPQPFEIPSVSSEPLGSSRFDIGGLIDFGRMTRLRRPEWDQRWLVASGAGGPSIDSCQPLGPGAADLVIHRGMPAATSAAFLANVAHFSGAMAHGMHTHTGSTRPPETESSGTAGLLATANVIAAAQKRQGVTTSLQAVSSGPSDAFAVYKGAGPSSDERRTGHSEFDSPSSSQNSSKNRRATHPATPNTTRSSPNSQENSGDRKEKGYQRISFKQRMRIRGRQLLQARSHHPEGEQKRQHKTCSTDGAAAVCAPAVARRRFPARVVSAPMGHLEAATLRRQQARRYDRDDSSSIRSSEEYLEMPETPRAGPVTVEATTGARVKVLRKEREGELYIMVFNAIRQMYNKLYAQKFIGGTAMLILGASLDHSIDFALGKLRKNPIKAWKEVLDSLPLNVATNNSGGGESHDVIITEEMTGFEFEWRSLVARLKCIGRRGSLGRLLQSKLKQHWMRAALTYSAAVGDLETITAYVDVHEELLFKGGPSLELLLGPKLVASYRRQVLEAKQFISVLRCAYPEAYPYTLAVHAATLLINLKAQLVEEQYQKGLIQDEDFRALAHLFEEQLRHLGAFRPADFAMLLAWLKERCSCKHVAADQVRLCSDEKRHHPARDDPEEGPTNVEGEVELISTTGDVKNSVPNHLK